MHYFFKAEEGQDEKVAHKFVAKKLVALVEKLTMIQHFHLWLMADVTHDFREKCGDVL